MGDAYRPLADARVVAPIASELLRHGACRETARVRREPAAERGVPKHAHPLHQRLDLRSWRNIVPIARVIERTTREEPNGHAAQVTQPAADKPASGLMPAKSVQSSPDDHCVEAGGLRRVSRWKQINVKALGPQRLCYCVGDACSAAAFRSPGDKNSHLAS